MAHECRPATIEVGHERCAVGVPFGKFCIVLQRLLHSYEYKLEFEFIRR
jgi:hypothetical protein